MNNSLKISFDLRPCIVNGEKGLFHRWFEEDDGMYKRIFALVEFEGGIMAKCKMLNVVFCDNLINQYYFGEFEKDVE